MSYWLAALCGALFGAIGPVAWAFAVRAGHYFADGSGILEKIIWIFPTSFLFLGFPQADLAHPKVLLQAEITALIANVAFWCLLAIAALALWRLVMGA